MPRCLTTAMLHGASRTTSSIVGEKTASVPRLAARPAAPAEDDQVGLFLGGELDDAFGGPPADAHDGAQLDALRRELEHALEQAPRLARPRRALGKRHALGHLDDAERSQRAARAAAAPRRCERGRPPSAGWPAGSGCALARRPWRSCVGGVALATVATGLAVHGRALPALDEIRLGQLEDARLALDKRLGLIGRQLCRLEDEAGDAGEVERHERRDESVHGQADAACHATAMS